eukprot:2020183-Amphidinium_carterae.1
MSKDSDRAGITAVLKDETHDRLILDRRPRSALEGGVSRASRHLTPAWRLTEGHLHPWERWRLFSTDLREMFYSFEITEMRASTNAVAVQLSSVGKIQRHRGIQNPSHPIPRVSGFGLGGTST